MAAQLPEDAGGALPGAAQPGAKAGWIMIKIGVRRRAGNAPPCPAIRVTGKQTMAVSVDAAMRRSLASSAGGIGEVV